MPIRMMTSVIILKQCNGHPNSTVNQAVWAAIHVRLATQCACASTSLCIVDQADRMRGPAQAYTCLRAIGQVDRMREPMQACTHLRAIGQADCMRLIRVK